MLIKPKPINIGEDSFDGFDLLDRASAAHQLTELVDRIEAPMVIALDGDWGTGKSWFLKLWPGEHKKKGGCSDIIYFDAFAHDFLDDPLASLALRLEAEMNKRRGAKAKAVRAVTTAVKKLAHPIARVTAAVATTGASEAVASVTTAVISEIGALRDRLWKEEKLKLKAMEDFRSAIANLSKKQPLVFIVDELDRCRPDYSLSLLEIIKHFFDVPHVHFVLGANLKALQNSVKVRYGNDIDAELYLQKFINLTMTLPDSKNIPSTIFYMDTMKNRILSDRQIDSGKNNLIIIIGRIIRLPNICSNLTLRGVERIFDRISVIPRSVGGLREVELTMIALGLILEAINRDLFYNYLNYSEIDDETKILISEEDRESSSGLTNDSERMIGLYTEMMGHRAGEDTRAYIQRQYSDFADLDFGSNIRSALKEIFGTFHVMNPTESLATKG